MYSTAFLETSTLETKIVSFRWLTLISKFKIFLIRYQIICDTIRLHNTHTEGYVVRVCLEKNDGKNKM